MNEAVDFHIDTGAEVSVIPDQVHKKLGSPTLTPPNQTLKGPSNEVNSLWNWYGVTMSNYMSLRDYTDHCWDESLQLVQWVRGVQTGKLNPVQQFPSLFQGLGKLQGEYSIKLQEGAKPYALTTSQCVPIPLMKPVKAELERMEKLEVISRVSEPTDWCAGMVVVPKLNGQVHICVDLTWLNDSVCSGRHPLPSVDQTMAQLAGAKVFSKLDANSGFWQIPLSPKSIPLTTFTTPFGWFCFNRLPFGITSAPEHFQRCMSEILGDLKELFVWLMTSSFTEGPRKSTTSVCLKSCVGYRRKAWR